MKKALTTAFEFCKEHFGYLAIIIYCICTYNWFGAIGFAAAISHSVNTQSALDLCSDLIKKLGEYHKMYMEAKYPKK